MTPVERRDMKLDGFGDDWGLFPVWIRYSNRQGQRFKKEIFSCRAFRDCTYADTTLRIHDLKKGEL